MTNLQQLSKLLSLFRKIEFSHKMAVIERKKKIKADTHPFSKMAFIQMDIKIVSTSNYIYKIHN